jgi:hypothetical protein
MKGDPLLRSLAHDPRYRAFLKKRNSRRIKHKCL